MYSVILSPSLGQCEFLRVDRDDFAEVLLSVTNTEYNNRLEFLQGLSLFNDWSEDELKAINNTCRNTEYSANEVRPWVFTVAEKYKPPTLADFSPMLHISLLRWWISLLPCTFLSYAGRFLSYTADVSPTLAD